MKDLIIKHTASDVAIHFNLHHDLDLEISSSYSISSISSRKKMYNYFKKKETYQLKIYLTLLTYWKSGIKLGHQFLLWPWNWPWIFIVACSICYIFGKIGLIASKQKKIIYIILWSWEYDLSNKKMLLKNNGCPVAHGDWKLKWGGPIWPWANKIIMGW